MTRFRVVRRGCKGLYQQYEFSCAAATGATGIGFVGNTIRTKRGKYFVDTKQVFTRPADLSIQIRQNGGSSECGVVSLFPQSNTRHSGYNAGVGWWRKYFGAGIDGSIAKRGNNNGRTDQWHTVK